MSTRRAVFQLKADTSAEFTRIVRVDLLPPLRAREGCRHEDVFVTPELSGAVINRTEEFHVTS